MVNSMNKEQHPAWSTIQEIKAAFESKDYARVLVLAKSEGLPENVKARALSRHATETYPGLAAREENGRGNEVYPGYYTVVLGSGHMTFKVWDQDEDSDFAPGQTILGRLRGSENEKKSSYQGVAFVSDEYRKIHLWKRYRNDDALVEAIRVLREDTGAAEKGYAVQCKNCYVCGRLLSHPDSIEAGAGKKCLANRREMG